MPLGHMDALPHDIYLKQNVGSSLSPVDELVNFSASPRSFSIAF